MKMVYDYVNLETDAVRISFYYVHPGIIYKRKILKSASPSQKFRIQLLINHNDLTGYKNIPLVTQHQDTHTYLVQSNNSKKK